MSKEIIEEHDEFGADLSALLLKYVDQSDKMDQLPSILLSMIVKSAAIMTTVGMDKEEAMEFITETYSAAYDHEKAKTDMIKELLSGLDLEED